MKLLYLTAAWVGGLLLGLAVQPPIWVLILLLVALPGLILAWFVLSGIRAVDWRGFRMPKLWTIVFAVLVPAVFLAGILRANALDSPTPLADDKLGRESVVVGTIAEPPERTGSAYRFVLKADSISHGQGLEDFDADVMVSIGPHEEHTIRNEAPQFRYGDRLILEGTLEHPPVLDTFDYRDYLARQGIHLVMDFPDSELVAEGDGSAILTTIYGIRDAIGRSLERALPEPQAAVAQTLLVGKRDNLPAELQESFRSTGTSHLLAISGLHVGVVLALTMAGSAFVLGRKRSYFIVVPLLALWGYTLLSGMSPSVIRAAIMGTIYLAAVAAGRPRNVFPTLAVAAAVMAGLNPGILRDLSFQLSFAAVAGIAVLTPPLTDWFEEKLKLTHERGGGFVRAVARGALLSAVVSLAATLATLPLVAFHFQQLPTLGIPATVLALVAMPAILITSAITAIAAAIHPVLGQVFGWIAYAPITYLTS